MKNLILFALLIAISGCASVPATKVSINPTTGAITLESPKEIGISNMIATLPNGVTVQLQGYQSHNSVDVLSAVAAANAQTLSQAVDLLKSIRAAQGGMAPILVP
jgi:hypothetical protein